MSGLELGAIADFLDMKTFRRGDVIYREGDRGSDLFIVYTGIVGCFTTGNDGTRYEQEPFAPKAFFGEMSLVDGDERAETCYALEDVRLLVLSGLDFYRIVWDYSMLAVKLLKAMNLEMAKRLSRASWFLNDMVRWGEIARRRAVTDDLSGLFNRRFLEESVQTRFSRGISGSRKCSILLIDFDYFRDINLKYGALAGDAVISTAGATIQRVVSERDIPARLSGDEFAILLPDSGREDAMRLAGSLQSEIASLFLEFRTGPDARPEKVILTISVGVATSPDNGKTGAELFDAADSALYRAKQEGRNRVRCC